MAAQRNAAMAFQAAQMMPYWPAVYHPFLQQLALQQRNNAAIYSPPNSPPQSNTSEMRSKAKEKSVNGELLY